MVRVYCVCLDGAPPNLMVRLAEEGTLPNLGRVLANGSWSRALPSLPTVTSVNWTTIATGLHCGTHGRPYSSSRVRYFWEAAEAQGIPVGLANIEHNEVGESTFFVGHPRMLAGAMTLRIDEPGQTVEASIKTPDGQDLAEACCTVEETLELEIRGHTRSRIEAELDQLSDHVVFAASDEDTTTVCTSAKYTTSTSMLYVSPIRAMSGFVEPPSLEPEILEIAGPPPVKGFPLFHHRQADIDTAIEEETRHALWFGRIAGGTMAHHDDCLWFHRHNTTDGIGHYYLGLLDERACCYDKDHLDDNWAAARCWYATLDLIFGEILRRDPQPRFAICTDHGQVGYRRLVSLAKVFVDRGLAHASANARRRLDPERSRILIESDEIIINLENRDPPGPVRIEDYEEVRDSVVEALRGLTDPETSRHVVALALRREDAQGLLFWGRSRGDVLFMLEGGYFCPNGFILEDEFSDFCWPTNSSVHHGCLPGYETEIGSNYSFMAFSEGGAGERQIQGLGTPHLVDFGPTVLALLGVSAKWLQGRVLWDMIRDAEHSSEDRQ